MFSLCTSDLPLCFLKLFFCRCHKMLILQPPNSRPWSNGELWNELLPQANILKYLRVLWGVKQSMRSTGWELSAVKWINLCQNPHPKEIWSKFRRSMLNVFSLLERPQDPPGGARKCCWVKWTSGLFPLWTDCGWVAVNGRMNDKPQNYKLHVFTDTIVLLLAS